jgi:ATP-dependent exoDNAse (exonuclease V) alpha subunit
LSTGDRIEECSTSKVWDYTRKQGVEHTEIVLPTEVAKRDINWARDREQLWNAAEAFEKRKDARVAREWEIALPHELGRTQRVDLAREFAGEIANRYGCAVDVAIHRPHRLGDHRNHHAYLFATTRTVEAVGLGRKTDIELGDRDRFKKGLENGAKEITPMRARWETLLNQRLKEHGIDAPVDHRSLKARGIEREPTVHLGPSVIGMERRGIQTEVGDRVREERAAELERAQAKAAEVKSLERESCVLSACLATAARCGSLSMESGSPIRSLGRSFRTTIEALYRHGLKRLAPNVPLRHSCAASGMRRSGPLALDR